MLFAAPEGTIALERGRHPSPRSHPPPCGRGGESGMSIPETAQILPTVIDRLKARYPDARYELNWKNPLELLVATILAAQCTDERVNQVTPGLFAKYPDARAFAEANTAELEEDLKPTGFYRNKAKAVQGACRALVE